MNATKTNYQMKMNEMSKYKNIRRVQLRDIYWHHLLDTYANCHYVYCVFLSSQTSQIYRLI